MPNRELKTPRKGLVVLALAALAVFAPGAAQAAVPAAPSGLTATVLSSSKVQLAWTDNATDEIYNYVEYRKLTDPVDVFSTATWLGGTAAPAYTHQGLLQATTYVYRIRAYNASGSSYSNEVTVTTPAVAAPGGLTITAVSYGQITLAWTYDASDVTSFALERGTSLTNFAPVTSLSASYRTFTNNGLAQGTEYFYRIRAVSGSNFSDFSGVASATTPVLAAPSNVSATAVSASQIDVSWTDTTSDETAFYVFYKETGAAAYSSKWAAANSTSQSLTYLKPGTEYTLHVKAMSGVYSDASNEVTATTEPLNAPSGLTVTDVSYGSVTLSWTDNSNGEQYFRIERKEGIDGPWEYVAGPPANATTYAISYLKPGTEYSFRVYAVAGSVNSSYSNDAAATTLALDAPSNAAATAVSASQIDVSWTDTTSVETGFYVYYKETAAANYSRRSVTANSTGVSLTNLKPDTEYTMHVSSYVSTAVSQPSNETTARTEALVAPSGLTVTGIGINSVTLSWTDNSNGEQGFRIERKIGPDGTWAYAAGPPANATTYTVSSLNQGTEYYFRLCAYAGSVQTDYTNDASATTEVLNGPTALTVAGTSLNSVTLSWTDNSNGETGFRIERLAAPEGTVLQVYYAGANATTYTVPSLTMNTEYFFRVYAYAGSVKSSYSNGASATTDNLSAPAGLTVTGTSFNSVTLSWTDTTNGETGFKIERLDAPAGPVVQVYYAGANATTYTVPSLSLNTEYYFQVRSYFGSTNSDPSGVATAATQVFSAPGNLTAVALSGTRVQLAWTGSGVSGTSYSVEYKVETADPFQPLDATIQTSYVHAGAIAGTTYVYRVRAYLSNLGYSDYSNEATATPQNAVPAGLQAVARSSKRITLSWAAMSGITEFELEVSTGPSGSFVPLATLPADAVSYTHTELTAGTDYAYRIRAFDGYSYSAYSEAATARTFECREEGRYVE